MNSNIGIHTNSFALLCGLRQHGTYGRKIKGMLPTKTHAPAPVEIADLAMGKALKGDENKTTLIDIEELQRRFEEAEQTIEAIRKGEVDAIVRPGEEGFGIYILESGDRPHRNIVETMNAGAVTIDEDDIIYYSNAVFSKMTGIPLQSLIGSSFKSLIVPEDHCFSILSRKAVKEKEQSKR